MSFVLGYSLFMLCVVVAFVTSTLYTLNCSFYLLIQRIRGRKIIIIEGIGGAIKGDVWKSHLVTLPVTQKVSALRYPNTGIGTVMINNDGTGYYCGELVWKYI